MVPPPGAVHVDEAHKIKYGGTVLWTELTSVVQGARRRVPLVAHTGTPIVHGPRDLEGFVAATAWPEHSKSVLEEYEDPYALLPLLLPIYFPNLFLLVPCLRISPNPQYSSSCPFSGWVVASYCLHLLDVPP